MHIVILGGSGLIGKQVAARLQQAGHRATPASPSTGVNAVTGEGLSQVLGDADVVVDVTNSPSFEDEAVMHFFRASAENLLAACARSGVRHLVALSVVGSERVPESGYFRAKIAQEGLIKAGPVPYTIVRATQFFEFLPAIAQASTEGQTVRMPSALLQPIASADVAAELADVVMQPPLNGTREVAGSEAIPLDELVRRVLVARHDERVVVTDPDARYFGSRLDDRSLVPQQAATLGATSLAQWLARTATA